MSEPNDSAKNAAEKVLTFLDDRYKAGMAFRDDEVASLIRSEMPDLSAYEKLVDAVRDYEQKTAKVLYVACFTDVDEWKAEARERNESQKRMFAALAAIDKPKEVSNE